MVFKSLLFSVLAVAVISVSACASGKYDAVMGGGTLSLELAVSRSERARGLMYRRTLARNSGMLFVFPDTARRAFWMKNTFVPLSIAFLDGNLRVVSIHHLKPHDRTPVGPAIPVMYALEVNRGWFLKHGVRSGMRLRPGGRLKRVLSRQRRQ